MRLRSLASACLCLAACGNDSGTRPYDAAVGPGVPDASVSDAPGNDSPTSIDASALPDGHVAPPPDAQAGVPDAGVTPPDAHVPPPDAYVPPPDAYVPPPDAHVPQPDAHVPPPDAAPPPGGCQPLDLTPAEACAATLTGQVTACSISGDGTPSQDGWLEVERPDGTHGYLCATSWYDVGGFYFSDDRLHLLASSSPCCGGPSSSEGPAVTDAALGTLHGPTYIRPQETTAWTGDDLRQNPFAVIVSSTDAAAVYQSRVAQWKSWEGDGQAHAAPDGSGSYYFPDYLPVDWVIVPSAGGKPMIIIGPEVTTDASYTRPLGHPTLGACTGNGGAPMAYLGGTIVNTLLTNRSGRFGHESTVTPQHLENAADLFNCYGIEITDTEFVTN